MVSVGGLTALVGTFAVTAAFYALTLHLAARTVLGTVPILRAAVVGVGVAVVQFALRSYGPGATILVSAVADLVAIQMVYRLSYRSAGLVALLHYTVTVIAGLVIFNAVRLLSTAPM